jgi:hypothetical protein
MSRSLLDVAREHGVQRRLSPVAAPDVDWGLKTDAEIRSDPDIQACSLIRSPQNHDKNLNSQNTGRKPRNSRRS